MISLFTPEQRQDIYEMILQQLRDDDRITGILAMGSEDVAFRDDVDPIDLLIIIEKPSIIDIVFTLWVKRFEDMFGSDEPFHVLINEDLHTVHLLTPNYLQISAQFRSVNRFYLMGNDWCIAFDRVGHIQEYLEKREQSREQAIRNLYQSHMHTVWQPVLSCARELKRDNLWKAMSELNILRKIAVEVAGIRYLAFTEDYRNMEYLPDMFRVLLRHTLPTTVSPHAIRRSLKATLNMLFTETLMLDEHFGTDYTDQLEERLNTFVELYT